MKKWLCVMSGILGALLCTLIVCAVLIVSYADKTDERHTDCAIVLGAGVGNNGPSPVFRERIHHGVKLYEEGKTDKLIFTGGVGEGTRISEGETAKRYALSLGVPEEAILVEKSSRYTHENLQFAKKLMEKNGLETASIVSDPLHMKRAMLTAKDTGMDCSPSPTQTSRYESLRTKASFLWRETLCYIGYGIYRLFV